MLSLKKHRATENLPVEWCIGQLEDRMQSSGRLIRKISHIFEIKKDAKILELGAAQGLSVISFQKLGYDMVGIEPSENALKTAGALSRKLDMGLDIKKGYGENIPYDSEIFDVVIADSVIEHVRDVKKVFQEVCRVLKPTGCFYFSTASSLCPKQDEIRFFPCFSWYPDKIKIRIMNWAVNNRPDLVGHTTAPAINWFTPWKAENLLSDAGFHAVYDRWEMAAGDRLGEFEMSLIKLINSIRLLKIAADMAKSGCAYLGVKQKSQGKVQAG